MQTYVGGCHCGTYRYEVETDLEKVISCNCSHCHIKGLVLTFVSPEQFRLIEGNEAELTDYQFNKNRIHHLFCPSCGVEAFARGTKADGSAVVAINVRCLTGVELGTLATVPVDGRAY